MRKIEIIFLSFLIVFGLVVRLYKFEAPIADWHSWRQTDTSSVSRNFVQNGIDLFHPKFDDLSNVQSGGKHDNLQGYRLAEFPLYNFFQAQGFLIFDKFSLEEWGRIVSIFSSLISGVFFYFLLRRHSGIRVAAFSTFFLIFLPFSIFWSRTVLPDSLFIALILGTLLFFDLWIKEQNKKRKFYYYLLSIIFSSLSVLIKPFAVFFFLPALFLSFEKWGTQIHKRKDLIILLLFAIFPFLVWRLWGLRFPGGVPDSTWLFNEGNIRFKPAFFYWIFGNRISELILGFWGLPLLILGIIRKQKSLFFHSFLLSSILYLFIIAKGNVQHSYYQIPLIPTIALFLGLGSDFLLNPAKQFFSKRFSYIILVFAIFLMFLLSYREIKDFYNIQNPSILAAGQAMDRLTPKDAKVLAPMEGDTSLLYFTKRKGWASFSKPLPILIKMGASYLVLVNPKKQDYEIGKTYKIIASSPQYIIFDLKQKP